MVDSIMESVGIPYRRGRIAAPPKGTYAVYADDVASYGADGAEAVYFSHNVTVEVYEPTPDDVTESAIEKSITANGLLYTKQDRYWLQTEQLYQVIYHFEYFKKRSAF